LNESVAAAPTFVTLPKARGLNASRGVAAAFGAAQKVRDHLADHKNQRRHNCRRYNQGFDTPILINSQALSGSFEALSVLASPHLLIQLP
jgi:hypothetical protein